MVGSYDDVSMSETVTCDQVYALIALALIVLPQRLYSEHIPQQMRNSHSRHH